MQILHMVVKKCQYLPRHIWQWWQGSVNTSPAKVWRGIGQVSLPPPSNLAEEVDKCHLPPPPAISGRTDQPTLKAISRPASARAAGKNLKQHKCSECKSSFVNAHNLKRHVKHLHNYISQT